MAAPNNEIYTTREFYLILLKIEETATLFSKISDWSWSSFHLYNIPCIRLNISEPRAIKGGVEAGSLTSSSQHASASPAESATLLFDCARLPQLIVEPHSHCTYQSTYRSKILTGSGRGHVKRNPLPADTRVLHPWETRPSMWFFNLQHWFANRQSSGMN